jgi:DNA-binding NarL/FixJ family response regulator
VTCCQLASCPQQFLVKVSRRLPAVVGLSFANKEIAQRMGITIHTVSNYLFRIYNKLSISSRVELVLSVMREVQRMMLGNGPRECRQSGATA